MKIKPLFTQILVKPDEKEKYQGKVILPDLLEKQVQTGIVLKVGADVIQVNKGDHIYWKELAGTYIDDLLLVDENDILLKYEEVQSPRLNL